MEKIFMIGLFPSCVYVLWIFSTTYMNYLHPSSMCIIWTKNFIYYQLWIAKKPESRLPDQEEASMASTEYQIELEESMAYMHQCCGQKHSNRSWRHTDPSWSMQSCKSEIPLVLCTSESGSQCRYMCLYIVLYSTYENYIQLVPRHHSINNKYILISNISHPKNVQYRNFYLSYYLWALEYCEYLIVVL